LWVPFWSQSILHYGFYNSTDYWSNSDTSVICNSSDINDYEIDIITELTTQEDIPEPTYEEINTALSVMKKGKAADVICNMQFGTFSFEHRR
jgi:hypothetical protein